MPKPDKRRYVEPTGPSPSLGLRTISLPKAEFDDVVGGLWRISTNITARAGPRASAFTSLSPTASVRPSWAVTVDAPGTPPARRRPDPPRSIFGLPIISCKDVYYSVWVLLILLLDLTYSAFLLPLSIGFQVNDLQWTWACYVDLAAGLFFAVELFLGFHVSYLASNSGQAREVTGGRSVARYYIRHGSFWQDLLSTAVWITQIVLLVVHQAVDVPMTTSSSSFQYIRIVRMIRFVLVLRQLFALTVTSSGGSLIPGLHVPPRLAQGLNITYSSIVLLHFFACLWNFIALAQGMENTWLNTVAALVRRHSADGASPLTADELNAVSGGERYVLGFYFSAVTIATLGYGDIVPVNTAEYLIDSFIVAVGVMLFGLAMGSLAEMVASSSKQARQAQVYRDKIEGVDAWLHSTSISGPLKQKIRFFYSDVWLRHSMSRANVAEQFRELPHSLRQEVSWEVNRKPLTRLSLFRELSESQRFALAGFLAPLHLTPGQELCLHGEPSDRIWLLHEGEVQVFDECSVLRVISAPAVLGVEALLQHVDDACATRPYGYRTESACTLWEGHLEEMLPYLLANPGALDALSSRAHEQREAEAQAMRANAAAAGGAADADADADGAADADAGASDDSPADVAHVHPDSDRAAAQGLGNVFGKGGLSHAGSGASGAGLRTLPSGLQHVHSGGSSRLQHASSGGSGGAAGQQEATGGSQYVTPGQISGLASNVHSRGTSDLPAACGEDAGAAVTKGELFQLRQEVVHKLDSLGEDMRRALAAASLAHSVANQRGRSPSVFAPGAAPRGRRISRADSHIQMAAAATGALQRSGTRKWSFGQMNGSP